MQTQLLRASVRRASRTSASLPPTSMPPGCRPLRMPSRSSSRRSMPTPWTYSSIASRRAARRTAPPSCCSIKAGWHGEKTLVVPVGGAIHSIKSVHVPLPHELSRTHRGSRRIALYFVYSWSSEAKGMAAAIILVLVALGSVLFHLLSPWWWTPIASNWSYIDHTISITFLISGIAFTAILLFMAYCVFRFRHQEGTRAVYNPENKKLEWWLTIATAVGVGAMLAPGLFVWNQFITVPQGASEVEIIGRQWQWSFRLPGEDGRLGTSHIHYLTSHTPLGLNPNDRDAHDDVVIEADDLQLLVDKPVKLLQRSIDVLHSFYVPEFRAKMDLVPGMVTYVWFTPTRTGTFEMLCTELCGSAH